MARARGLAARIDRSALVEHVRTPLFHNGYALILSAISTSGLGIVYWALAAKFYLTQDVGLNSAAISSMMLLSGIAQLNLMGALIRFIPTAGRATARLVGFSYLVSIVVAVVLGLGLFLTRDMWTPVPRLFDDNPQFLLWFVVATIAWGVFALQDFVLTGLRQAIWVPAENIVFALVKIVLLVALAGSYPLYGIFISWTVPTLLAVLVMNALIFFRLIPAHVRAREMHAQPIAARPLISYVAGNYVGFLFFLASTTLPPVLVESINGPDAAAYFYLAWIFAYSIQLISQNMAASLTVEGAIDQGQLEVYSARVLLHIARLVIPIVVLFLIGAPFILQLFGSDYAANGADLLRLLSLAAIPNIVNVLYIGIARVQQRNRAIMVVQGVLCVLCLGMSVILLHTQGLLGVGIAWVIGQSMVAAALMLTHLRPLVIPTLMRRPGRVG